MTASLILIPARAAPAVTDPDVGVVPRPLSYVLQTYVDFVRAAGATPLIVPLTDAPLDDAPPDSAAAAPLAPVLELLRSGSVAGLLLPGGADLDPRLYHETNKHCGSVSPGADYVDSLLFEVALEHKVPVFGICRGMQLINVALGGSCWQTMSDEALKVHDRHDLPRNTLMHRVQLAKDSRFRSMLDGVDEVELNSLHHQCVKRLGKGLRVVASVPFEGCDAVAEPKTGYVFEGPEVIEIIEHTELPVFGVQAHPEELVSSGPWVNFFRRLISRE